MNGSDGEPAGVTPAQFHRVPGVADWRVTSTGPQAVFLASSLAAAACRAAAELELRPDPSRVQAVDIYVAQHSATDARPFFLAALGYEPVGDGDAVDPLRRGPQLALNPLTGDIPGRGRTHLDVVVPADHAQARVDAALAAAWWSLASPDNHGVDIASWTDTSSS